jgi:SAM-dependent methyltransferase
MQQLAGLDEPRPWLVAAGGPGHARAPAHVCRACAGRLEPFVDLGLSPLCEGFLTERERDEPLMFYPLSVRICTACWLGQLPEFVTPAAIFSDYAYFSSFSEAWLAHARGYVAAMVERFGLGGGSHVVEVASNDGYLLRNFVERGIPCLGIEPAANVAEAAEAVGVPTLVAFFGHSLAARLARDGGAADLIAGNNVLAQVPDLNDFVAGLAALLKPDGVVTLEFPHLLRLIEDNQFDTIYHEHFSYFSLASVEALMARHGLRVFDVERLWTHGGSLRVFACRTASSRPECAGVRDVRGAEQAGGIHELATYQAFQARVEHTKRALLALLIRLKADGKRIAGYGAPGKGNTLLNYCGIRTDFVDFTVDRNPHKHGKFLPGTGIPILPPDAIERARPDYVLILPWNLKGEITRQLAHIRDWGGRFIVPIPEAEILG